MDHHQGNNGKGRGQRKGRSFNPHEKTSRALSKILRHQTARRRIPIDSAGWCQLDRILAQPELRGITLADVKVVVEDNDKQRFSLEDRSGDGADGVWYIRANQGHSTRGINSTELCEQIRDASLFPVVVHGTNPNAWAGGISTTGLKRMKRQHIHFAKGLPGENGVISGIRKGNAARILVYVDLEQCLADGIPFFVSANGVILSPGIGDTGIIPPKYFKSVIDNSTGETLIGSQK